VSHYGVQVRVFLDSVGQILGSGDRTYHLALDGSQFTFNGAAGRMLDSCGIVGLDATQSMTGHSASIEVLVGDVGAVLRTHVECQDTLRIELNIGNGWECAFDGFISQVSCTQTSSVQGYSWRLSLAAEGIHKLFGQLWANWGSALVAGQADWLTAAGRALQDEFMHDMGLSKPSDIVHRLLDFGVSNLMQLTVRGGSLGIGGFWQTGDETPDAGRLWNSAFELSLTASVTTYLTATAPLMSIVQGVMEPDLHEMFVTYRKGTSGQVPTLVFRPQPFPAGSADSGEWDALAPDALVMGSGDNPAPISVSSSKSDAGRANAFFWTLTSANDSSNIDFFCKCAPGFWVDKNSIQKYGFSSHQFHTSMASRSEPLWWTTIIPQALRRVAYQMHPLPFLWRQRRTYPLTPQARIGTPLLDASDGICGYITQVSHRVSSTPSGFKAATTLSVERVIEGVKSVSDYPAAVYALSPFLAQATFLASKEVAVASGEAQPASVAPPPTRAAVPTPGAKAYPPPPKATGENRVVPCALPIRGNVIGDKRGCSGTHMGVDYPMAPTPVVAPCDGHFTKYTTAGGGGTTAHFVGADGKTMHAFAHLSITANITPGTALVAGVTKLGTTGGVKGAPGSGNSSGPHLHWAMSYKGNPVDPSLWLSGS